jgi:ABC-type Zn uptake system ZnuABC Zn-binding protein ZnuA
MILILITAGATAVPSTLIGCGSTDQGGQPVVAASTGILADITAGVGGEDVEVVQLIPDTASPHDFQPSAEDRQNLVEADLVSYNGAGLDADVPVDDADAPTWALTDHVPDLLPLVEDGHAEEGANDPHVWMDPIRVAAALPSLADALAVIDPENADAYKDRARAFAKQLQRLDAEIAKSIHALPASDRQLVTSHDALGYFADRYGLTVVATPFSATGPDAEPSAATLAEVIDAVKRTDAPALFAEETDDPEILESIAAETGATVVDELLVEAPGSAGSYEAMLRHDGELIAASLRD